MTKPQPEEQELSQVVLGQRGIHRLRPLWFALFFLLCLEGILRLTLPPDERVLRDPQNPYGCFREDDLFRFAHARRTAPVSLDVVLLGDSVLSATNNREGQRVEDYLGPILKERLSHIPGAKDLRVWNLGRGGARAVDLYFAVEQLLEVAEPKGDLLLVVNSNIIFFARRHQAPPMLYPCLAIGSRLLRFSKQDQTTLRKAFKLPEDPSILESTLQKGGVRGFYLYQQRRRLAELLFSGPPREALRERFLDLVGKLRLRPAASPSALDVDAPWTERGLSATSFRSAYDLIELTSKEALNYQMTQHLSGLLWDIQDQKKVPVHVFLTPQNHGLLGQLADTPAYHRTAKAIGEVFVGKKVPFRSYDHLVSDGLFLDLDHLTSKGNRRLAELLAEDLVVPAQRLLSAGGAGK